jgi:hypothetical protein
MTNTTLEKCAGCQAEPDSAHGDGCDWARCPDCGEQQLMCDETDRPAMWHGIDPRDEVTHAKDWWTTAAGIDHLVEDTFRVQVAEVRGEIRWNPETQRYDF